MTAEAVLMLTPSCPPSSLLTRRFLCGPLPALTSLCSLCFLYFLFFLSPPLISTRKKKRLQAKNSNIVPVRSGSQIEDRTTSEHTCWCWKAAESILRAKAKQRPPRLCFKQLVPSHTGRMFIFYIKVPLKSIHTTFQISSCIFNVLWRYFIVK